MRGRSGFRSPHGLCFSEKPTHVNVPGWLAATTLATRAPGRENRRFADCSPHPWDSPLRGQRKRCPKLLPAILSSAYPFRLPGRARCNVPVSHALSPHPCGLPRPEVNASAIFSRTQHLALIPSLKRFLCCCRVRSHSAGVERSAQHRFPCGAAGIDKGAAVAPYPVHV